MRTVRRIRNAAFLGLVVTLAWAGQVKLSADSGGYYCGYGDCRLTYDNCDGDWTYLSYPDPPLYAPGDCLIILENETNGDCDIDLSVHGGLYEWSYDEEDEGPWICHQLWPE